MKFYVLVVKTDKGIQAVFSPEIEKSLGNVALKNIAHSLGGELAIALVFKSEMFALEPIIRRAQCGLIYNTNISPYASRCKSMAAGRLPAPVLDYLINLNVNITIPEICANCATKIDQMLIYTLETVKNSTEFLKSISHRNAYEVNPETGEAYRNA